MESGKKKKEIVFIRNNFVEERVHREAKTQRKIKKGMLKVFSCR